MNPARLVVAAALLTVCAFSARAQDVGPGEVALSVADYKDKVLGGWLGQMIGNLVGLPHEFKYMDEPRADLPEFVPGLPEGGRTDDDTDIEWVHLHFMDRHKVAKLPYREVRRIWLDNMNDGIWVANLAARGLMFRGLHPPYTGHPAFNPHAWYNLSGQFCVDAYGLCAPGLPQTAADISLHYAHIAVWGEPIQAAQYWSAMTALAFTHTGTMEELIAAALPAVDSKSEHARMVQDAVRYYKLHPKDWKAARKLVHENWFKPGKWNANSTPTNGALVLLALLYGGGDFNKTMQLSFALGYDADCNAATAGTIVGVMMGAKKLQALPGWKLKDVYVNKTRGGLPEQVKITEQAEMIARIGERIIEDNRGRVFQKDGQAWYAIPRQTVKMLEALPEGPQPKLGDAATLRAALKQQEPALDFDDEDWFAYQTMLSFYGRTLIKNTAVLKKPLRQALIGREVRPPSWHHEPAAACALLLLGEEDALRHIVKIVQARDFNWVTAPDIVNTFRDLPAAARPAVKKAIEAGDLKKLGKDLDRLTAGWDK